MCNKITKIALQNRYQWIGVCAHGSAHVFWRTTHVCLPFKQLELLMNQSLAGKLPTEPYGNDYLLWLNQVAIKLNEQDLDEIQNLFTMGAEAKSAPMTKPTAIPPRPSKLVLH